MPNLMKDRYYNYDTIHELAMCVNAVYPTFPADDFIADVMDETWDTLELKARMRRITINLGKYLPPDYEHALGILDKAIADYPVGNVDSGLLYFPDFVEVYGQDERYWDLSMAALERYTQYSTAEFAVRPFVIKHEARMMAQMSAWAECDNEHTDWIIKHGCRTLLKKGNRDVLGIFGFADVDCVNINNFSLAATSVCIGKDMAFSFQIVANKETKVRLEYGIDYVKANGTRSRKIFKISEPSLRENEKKSYSKTHSFTDTSSRKHYCGIHSVTLIVNGVEWSTLNFEVTVASST